MNALGGVVPIVASAAVLAVVMYVWMIRPGLRAARIDARAALWRPLIGRAPPLADHADLVDLHAELARGFAVDAVARRAEELVRGFYFPDAHAGPNPDATIESVATGLADPRVAAIVASGEQLVHHLFDMALPGTPAFAVPGIATGVGMRAGAIVGAIKGRSIGVQIRRVPLDRAVSDYRVAALRVHARLSASAGSVVDAVARRSDDARRAMEHELRRRPTWAWTPSDLTLARELADALCAAVAGRVRAIDRAAAERLAEVPADAWHHALFGVSIGREVRGRIDDLHMRQRAEELEVARHVDAVARELADPVAAIAKLLAIRIAHDPRIDHALSRLLASLAVHRVALIERLDAWMAVAALRYRHELSEVCAVALAEAERHRSLVDQAAIELAPLREAVTRERAFGN